MSSRREQKGFILLLVVLIIPLVGMGAMVLNSNSRHIITQTRKHEIVLDAQLAVESGVDWIRAHREKSFSLNQPQTLNIDHDTKKITCRIELISQTPSQKVFTVTGDAEDKRFSRQYQQQYILTN